MSQPCFIGIDVACAKNKPLPICIAVREGDRLVPLPLQKLHIRPPRGRGNPAVLDAAQNCAYAAEARAYIEAVCAHYQLKPARIGLDSPLRPRAEAISFRLAERALLDAGIRCYKTPSATEFTTIQEKGLSLLAAGGAANKLPHGMQLFMLAGFAIAEELAEIAPLIEVFPQATIRLLWPSAPHKTQKGLSLLQLAKIAQYSGWPATTAEHDLVAQICGGQMHDKVDAYSAAWVASLPPEQRRCFGSEAADDAIWVPNLELIEKATQVK